MTDLSKLKVSLTKHGAHKVFELLQHFEPEEVLESTDDKFDGIKIDRAQAGQNLSAFTDGNLPGFWKSAKEDGRETLQQLVFLAILFSHHDLIRAFISGALGEGKGRIDRGTEVDAKAFTNLKNDIVELGLSLTSNTTEVDYDLSPIVENENLGKFASQLLALKLSAAG